MNDINIFYTKEYSRTRVCSSIGSGSQCKTNLYPITITWLRLRVVGYNTHRAESDGALIDDTVIIRNILDNSTYQELEPYDTDDPSILMSPFSALTTKGSPSPRTLARLPCLLNMICLLIAISRTACEPISAMNQAIGQWHVELSASQWFGGTNHLVFPPRQIYDEKDPAIKTRGSMHCHLSLFPNSTFCLSPLQEDLADIQGKWKVQSNPYCPTDRYYDNIVLESYRRTQKNESGDILQQGNFRLHAKLWGRYESYQVIRRKFKRIPRMSHGTIIWAKEGVKIPCRARRVCSTFTAKRFSSCLDKGVEVTNL